MVNPISFPQYQVNSTVDPSMWSSLAGLGKQYQQQQIDANKQRLLSQLGPDAAANANLLVAGGDPGLAEVGLRLQGQLRGETREDARYAVTDRRADEQLNIQKAQEARAAEKDAQDTPTWRAKNLVRQYGPDVLATPEGKAYVNPNYKPHIDTPSDFEIVDDGTGKLNRVRKVGQEGPIPGVTAAVKPNAFVKTALEADATRVDDYAKAARTAEESGGTLEQVKALRKEAYTGPVVGRVAAAVGHGATQALDTAVNSLSLDIAQRMKGSFSDKDIAFIKSQVPNLAQGGQAGDAAVSLLEQAFERTKQRHAFYRSWGEANGNINGADAAWRRYIEENPLTKEDKKSLGGRTFNPDYNKDFTPYMKGVKSTGLGSSADMAVAKARAAIAEGRDPAMVRQWLVEQGVPANSLGP